VTDRPLRITHVVAGVAVGGLQKHLSDLCAGQVEAGHAVSAAHHPSLDLSKIPRVACAQARLDRGRRDPRALLALGRALRRLEPDVIHAHASKAVAMTIAARALRLAPRRPVVATLHSVKRRTGAYERADRVIAVSPSAAAQVRRAPVEVIFNGVSIDASQPPAQDLRAERTTALAVGRLVEVKGFDLLLEAWREIDADLWIAGDGPQRAALERLIEREGLADRVRLLGMRRDVPSLMREASLVVIPSRREGFSYVMAEALVLGRPIVSTRVPGPMDLLPESLLAPVEDAAALRALIQRALANPDQTARDLAPVWDRAREELTLERMIERTEQVYRRAMGGGAPLAQ